MIGVLHITCLDILITQRRVLPYPVLTERDYERKRDREGGNTDRGTRWSTRLPFLASTVSGLSVEAWRQTQILLVRRQEPTPCHRLLHLCVQRDDIQRMNQCVTYLRQIAPLPTCQRTRTSTSSSQVFKVECKDSHPRVLKMEPAHIQVHGKSTLALPYY